MDDRPLRAQIHVNADASFDVQEAIDVDFGALQKHGIFRDIPVQYATGDALEQVILAAGSEGPN
ncbi:MAG: DUF2207 domain-containing protein [Chloroflexota bacterium]|nr:DUF2207 domain-containing protein [Chloroflexota bacterium]